jgi:hypothetical protein
MLRAVMFTGTVDVDKPDRPPIAPNGLDAAQAIPVDSARRGKTIHADFIGDTIPGKR